jgi:hypothetical protein
MARLRTAAAGEIADTILNSFSKLKRSYFVFEIFFFKMFLNVVTIYSATTGGAHHVTQPATGAYTSRGWPTLLALRVGRVLGYVALDGLPT